MWTKASIQVMPQGPTHTCEYALVGNNLVVRTGKGDKVACVPIPPELFWIHRDAGLACALLSVNVAAICKALDWS